MSLTHVDQSVLVYKTLQPSTTNNSQLYDRAGARQFHASYLFTHVQSLFIRNSNSNFVHSMFFNNKCNKCLPFRYNAAYLNFLLLDGRFALGHYTTNVTYSVEYSDMEHNFIFHRKKSACKITNMV